MAFRKYANDYKLEVQERPGKKPKSVPVYTGPLYRFTASDEVQSQLRRELPLLSFPATVCFIISLLLNGTILRQFYVIFPYFCAFLPYCYLCGAVVSFLVNKPPFTREQNDKIPTRIRHCCVGLIAFCGYALIAGIVSMILNRGELRLVWDIAFLALDAIQIVSAVLLFRRRAALDTETY